MKHAIIYLCACAIAFLSFSSCSKNDNPDNGDYYMKLKVKGEWVTLNTAFGDIEPVQGDPSRIALIASCADETQNTRFTINLFVDGPVLKTGTYRIEDADTELVLAYVKNAKSADPLFYSTDYYLGSGATIYDLTITSISDNVITGTFKGNFLKEAFTENPIEVTEGEFRLNRAK
jgi:hypothetical protein